MGNFKQTPSIVLFAAAGLLTGCGNALHNASNSMTLASTGGYGGANTSEALRNYSCPSIEENSGSLTHSFDLYEDSNVFPYGTPSTTTETAYDPLLNGSGFFEVCTHKQNTTQILMRGKGFGKSASVCVFAADHINDQNHYIKTIGSQFLIQCGAVEDGLLNVNFAYTSYNAVYAVDQLDKDQMISCLIEKNRNLCPMYSFGIFRASQYSL